MLGFSNPSLHLYESVQHCEPAVVHIFTIHQLSFTTSDIAMHLYICRPFQKSASESTLVHCCSFCRNIEFSICTTVPRCIVIHFLEPSLDSSLTFSLGKSIVGHNVLAPYSWAASAVLTIRTTLFCKLCFALTIQQLV